MIVQLDVGPAPASGIVPPEKIRHRRAALFDELRGTRYSDVMTYETAPLVALHAGRAALDVMERSPNVAGIEEDRPSGIGSSGTGSPG